MRITDLLNEQQLDELSFMGSQCTKDCSGHRAGYKWSLDRGGVENPASPSQSFINGSNIGHRQVQNNKQQRKQGGGRIKGYQSQTQQAIKKREQRAQAQAAAKSILAQQQAQAQAKVDQGVHGTPQNEGWQDFNKKEPYWVCIGGRKWKHFDYYEDARRCHDNLKKKWYKEGNPKYDTVTLLPDMDNR